jgi:hypothetical protein
MLYPNHRGENYRVYMLSCAPGLSAGKTLAVVSSREEADRLVDKYSEQFPNAYVDYTNSL